MTTIDEKLDGMLEEIRAFTLMRETRTFYKVRELVPAIALTVGLAFTATAQAEESLDEYGNQLCAGTNAVMAHYAEGESKALILNYTRYFGLFLSEEQKTEAVESVAFAYKTGVMPWEELVSIASDCILIIHEDR